MELSVPLDPFRLLRAHRLRREQLRRRRYGAGDVQTTQLLHRRRAAELLLQRSGRASESRHDASIKEMPPPAKSNIPRSSLS